MDKYYNSYRESFEQYGISYLALLWASEKSMEARFRVICEEIALQGKSLLDLGCGLGFFLDYLKNRGVTPSHYVGIDNKDFFIESNRHRFAPEMFLCEDLFKLRERYREERFDYTVASGLLSNIEDWRGAIDLMWDLCREGCAFNCLCRCSYQLDFTSHSLAEVIQTVERLTQTFVIRHDYLKYDFTVVMFKNETMY